VRRRIGAPNSGYIQSNRLARAFDFDVRYTKGEVKVCVLDRNPWLAKLHAPVNIGFVIMLFKWNKG